MHIQAISRTTLPQLADDLARFLIGKVVVREISDGRIVGRIVETEAYLHDDPAAHSFNGQTPRNRSLFLEGGHAYVYVSYGIHRMLNVAAGAHGTGTGVLIRAVEPLEGIPLMQARRGTTVLTDLARGPGRVAQAMDITLGLDGIDLTQPGPLWLGSINRPVGEIGVSIRIGITKAVDLPLRFFERGSKFVSGPRGLN